MQLLKRETESHFGHLNVEFGCFALCRTGLGCLEQVTVHWKSKTKKMKCQVGRR